MTAHGKPSVTHYETLEAHRFASLLEVGLETGRTHQIRVHMAALKHPCVGDLTYGADPTLAQRLHLTGQWLHAVGVDVHSSVDRRPGHDPFGLPGGSRCRVGCPARLAGLSRYNKASQPVRVHGFDGVAHIGLKGAAAVSIDDLSR